MKHWKLTIGNQDSKPFINLYYKTKRFRYWNGKAINLNLSSKSNPELLKSAFELKLLEGWRPKDKNVKVNEKNLTVVEALNKGFEIKVAQGCSKRYLKDLARLIQLWEKFERKKQFKNLLLKNLNTDHIKSFIIRRKWSPKTQRNIKSSLAPLLTDFKPKLVSQVKLQKPISKLHKPIIEIANLLNEIRQNSKNLYSCCILTYGCLLRPHREIRELSWGDFTSDLSYIKLSGEINKSGRNRIVPVPSYIKEKLERGESNHNIFTDSIKAPNPDYFKTLWSRFKRVSRLIQQDQTLYSFRHSGAIDIFKRTGSITKLQKAMGHSSINVSLTYLRGLEIPELTEEDMPVIKD
jgi:integrase